MKQWNVPSDSLPASKSFGKVGVNLVDYKQNHNFVKQYQIYIIIYICMYIVFW